MTDRHTIFACQIYTGSWQDAGQIDSSGSYLADRDLKYQLSDYRLFDRN
ncbi:hypothetical protein [Chamaesiphon polymorphus]|nr:hypothetical protein [Chamaesiphon polymorphus]